MPVQTSTEKMVQIITNSSLENRLINTLDEIGINGYTVFNVRGDGNTGLQDSHIDGDTNILLMIVVPQDVYEILMHSLNEYKKKGHHLMVFSVDVALLS